jgi:cation transport ATPase
MWCVCRRVSFTCVSPRQSISNFFALSSLLMLSSPQIGDESTINNILRLMEDAQSSKAPVQRFADRVILFCAVTFSNRGW